MINVQYANFRELNADQVFDIRGGGYDSIYSCFDSMLNFIHRFF